MGQRAGRQIARTIRGGWKVAHDPVRPERPGVRPALPEELALLGDVEREAGRRFSEIGMDLDSGVVVSERGELPLAAFVSGDPPVGFLWMTLVCGGAHVEEVAVRTAWGRRGIGRALLEASCRWAQTAGYRSVTLCTYRDVPWNGPFYRSAGFVELEEEDCCAELRALRATERANGLDDYGRRVVMLRRLGPPPPTGSTS